MANRDFLLLLGASMPMRERAAIGAARAFPDLPIADVVANPASDTSRRFDFLLAGAPYHPTKALEAVIRFVERTQRTPAAIVPFSELTLESAVLIAKHFDLPTLSGSLENVRDKLQMKLRFRAAGVSTPRFENVRRLSDLRRAFDSLSDGGPLVFKPARFGGSHGVSVVYTYEDCVRAFKNAKEEVARHKRDFPGCEGDFLLEGYIAGTEVSVEVLNAPSGRQVLAVVDKFVTEPPYCSERGHQVPSQHQGNAKLHTLALAACEALAIDRGLAHVELRLDKSGAPFVMEVAARPGGDGIHDLIERARPGANPYGWHVASYLTGELPREKLPEFEGTASIAFLKAKPGRIRGVTIPPKLPESISRLQIYASAGAISHLPRSNEDREGSVEFWWPKGMEPKKPGEGVRIAERLAKKIFR